MSIPTVSSSSAFAGLGSNQDTSGPIADATMDFYNLLTTQLTNQNPLEPVKETDFLGQMAQFSTVEQLQAMGLGLTSSQAEQRWLDAQDYLGRQVQWTAGEEGQTRSGEVDRIDRDESGDIWLEVDGSQVLLDKVVAVAPGKGSTKAITRTTK